MALRNIKGFMAKNSSLPPKKTEETHVTVESWQWDARPPRRWTWKHGLALIFIIVFLILFSFGFIVIAGTILIIGLIMNILLYILKKFS